MRRKCGLRKFLRNIRGVMLDLEIFTEICSVKRDVNVHVNVDWDKKGKVIHSLLNKLAILNHCCS